MIKRFLKYQRNLYFKVLRSIAFYPVLISLGFLVLAILMQTWESKKIASTLREVVPYLYIQDLDTARTILASLITGILSLTVFSFSMVMVVLNQASSNYSPRLLPGLVSDKRHQRILGVYTGTLIYCLIILISLGSYDPDNDSVGFSVMLAAVMGVICVSLFVYFIHSISNAIQIDTIIDGIYTNACNLITKKVDDVEEVRLDTDQWQLIRSECSGYFRGMNSRILSDYFKDCENEIVVLPFKDKHVWKGDPLLKIKNPVPDDALKSLLFSLHFSLDKHDGKSYLSDLTKLQEIAVKAMSPGINDPGTAKDVITKIGDLLDQSFQLPSLRTLSYDNKHLKLYATEIDTETLISMVIQPIRQYAAKDKAVLTDLIRSMLFLMSSEEIDQEKKDILSKEIEAVKHAVHHQIENPVDQESLKKFNL